MIINYDMVEVDMFGNLIVQYNPTITTSKEWLETMVHEPERRTPMWKEIIKELEERGIITEK